ncbi:MAG: tyrosine-type recombinase/integrase [Phycisphaerales bacterium]
MIASIFQPSRRRPDGTRQRSKLWYGQIRHDDEAKVRRFSLETTDKRVARKRFEERLQLELHEREGIIAPATVRQAASATMAEHLKTFVAELRTTGRTPDYIRKIRQRVQLLIDECEWKRLADVTPASFTAWRCSCTRTPQTINHYHAAANTMLCWMVSRRMLLANPLDGIERIDTRGRQSRPRRALTVEQQRALIAASGPRRLVYLMALQTGLRRGELSQLIWADVHLDARTPHLLARASTTKNRRDAPIALTPELIAELRSHRPADASGEARVFAGGMPSHHTIDADLERAGIPKLDELNRRIDFHALRHTFITNLHLVGTDQRTAMALARHSDARLTNSVYADASLLPVQHAIARLPTLTPGNGYRDQDAQEDAHAVCTPRPEPSHPVTEWGIGFASQVVDWQSVGHIPARDGTPGRKPDKQWSRGESNRTRIRSHDPGTPILRVGAQRNAQPTPRPSSRRWSKHGPSCPLRSVRRSRRSCEPRRPSRDPGSASPRRLRAHTVGRTTRRPFVRH